MHVVEVGRNFGGTGVFMDVLLFRRARRMITRDGVPRECRILQLVGSVSGRDRDDAAVTIDGNLVTVRWRERGTFSVLAE